MCKIPNTSLGIKRLDFTGRRGKMTVWFTDGRELTVPLAMFPDIKRLPLKDRKDWMVLDDQFFTFGRLSKVYSITDLLSVN